jgi:CheY-like chemotaxis protein
MMPETPVVLVVDGNPDRAERYAAWLDGECSVRTARAAPAAVEAVDDAVDVVVLVQPREVLPALREEGDGIKVVLVRGHDADLGALTRAPDEVVSMPVSPPLLRRTVSVLAAERTYADEIETLFSLAQERAAEEAADDLDARIDALRDRLDETLDHLVETGGFDAVYRAIGDAASDDDSD